MFFGTQSCVLAWSEILVLVLNQEHCIVLFCIIIWQFERNISFELHREFTFMKNGAAVVVFCHSIEFQKIWSWSKSQSYFAAVTPKLLFTEVQTATSWLLVDIQLIKIFSIIAWNRRNSKGYFCVMNNLSTRVFTHIRVLFW